MSSAVEIWSDGACSGNPGPGGWAAVLEFGGKQKEVFGWELATTNQRMELVAAIEGLNSLKRPCKVRLYSDSAYVVNAMREGWLEKWRRNGWRTSNKGPVKNAELWQALDLAASNHEVEWIKVKGHAENPNNNKADSLAFAMAQAARHKGVC